MSQKGGKSWPYQEARKILSELEARKETSGTVLFQTGFGPSGLPHIGTFAEVARTSFVRHAFGILSGLPSRIIAFSDDMDGLRKVPLNMPNRQELASHLGKPLSKIPDPFRQAESYSGFMNDKLREFLDRFGFEYEFRSSAKQYSSGAFDEGLMGVLQNYDAIRNLVRPTLRQEKREHWSPFLPLCSQCGRYTTRVVASHPERDSISYICDQGFGQLPASPKTAGVATEVATSAADGASSSVESAPSAAAKARSKQLVEGCGHEEETLVTGGRVKVGWKVDWALRWYTFGIHYEMYGKDLIESARLSGRITRILGRRPPVGFFYEMFLNEKGEKISKSVGKGLTVDTWLDYAPLESLTHYLFLNPRKARRLHYDVIPKETDAYLKDLRGWPKLDEARQLDNAIRFVHRTTVPEPWGGSITFSLVQNLVAAISSDDEELIFNYLQRYEEKVAENPEPVRNLIRGALAYYRDHLARLRKKRLPTREELPAFEHFAASLESTEDFSPEALQSLAFDTTRALGLDQRSFFTSCYEVLLGFQRGPRLGTFVALIGPRKIAARLREAVQKAGEA